MRVVFGGDSAAEADEDEAPYVTGPREAIVLRNGKAGVFVLQDAHARLVQVSLLKERGASVQIDSPLMGGETVLLSPPSSLVDGDAVRAP